MIARVPPPDLSRNGGQVGWSTNMSADDWPDALPECCRFMSYLVLMSTLVVAGGVPFYR